MGPLGVSWFLPECSFPTHLLLLHDLRALCVVHLLPLELSLGTRAFAFITTVFSLSGTHIDSISIK